MKEKLYSLVIILMLLIISSCNGCSNKSKDEELSAENIMDMYTSKYFKNSPSICYKKLIDQDILLTLTPYSYNYPYDSFFWNLNFLIMAVK